MRSLGRLPLVLALALVVALLGTGSAPSVDAQSAGPQERPPGEWVSLGPRDGFRISSFAVSPRWPADRFLIASDDNQVTRSEDGGVTWDRMGAPGVSVGSLVVAPPMLGGRIVFAISASGSGTGHGTGISRSRDGGLTWSTVLAIPTGLARPRSFQLSPSFADDGYAFATYNGILYRSQDYGVTWTTVSLVDGQRVQQVELSPAFAIDRTVVTAVVTGSFPPPWGTESEMMRTAVHHETSAGVMISTDGGNTWQLSSTGLAVGDTPYRYVRQIGLSPAFAQDGLVFAFAWGPWDGAAVPAALFRSSDRGQTWSPVWRSAAGRDGLQWSASFALSPSFGTDGVGQMALPGLSSWNAGPHGVAPCLTYTTRDGGLSWTQITGQEHPVRGCWDLAMAPGGPSGRVAYSRTYGGEGGPRSAHRSFDDGATWEWITPPVYPMGSSGNGNAWSYAVARDGTYFVETRQGIWAIGPSANTPTATTSLPFDRPGADR